ncbi:MAG: hypothetical protein ACJAUP_003052, partial [Cellvibrionaceae bacterium]
MFKDLSFNPISMAASRFSNPKYGGKQEISDSALTSAKLPRTLLISDFQLHKTKGNKYSFHQALVMGERGFGGLAVTPEAVCSLTKKIDLYLDLGRRDDRTEEYDAKDILEPLIRQARELPEFDETGSLTPNRVSDIGRDLLPMLAAQVTGREISILESTKGDSYSEVLRFSGHNSRLFGEG